jgi:TolB-like protein/class 3 adenylate cyclase/Flp pilus assembly protein TadD
VERKLTAILAADVVGYSRLMGDDEAGTLVALQSHREALIEPKAAQYGGRTVKLMGDGALMEFNSVVDAVAFAVEVQVAMRERNEGVTEDRQIVYRIGINLGDIIIQDEDIYGDGVNVAARLEGLAEPGGICLSRAARDQVRDKLDLDFEDLGEVEVKNITRPIRVFRVNLNDKAAGLATPVVHKATKPGHRRWMVAAAAVLLAAVGGVSWWQPWAPAFEMALVERMALPLPDKPSIAVLPFTNMSGDPDQEYFVDGMTEDLITDLSKVSGLFVIARNSTFIYKGKSVEIRNVAEDLGVRYVLEGSVRLSGDQVRVNAQLIDATSGGHIWAERYDGDVTDIFAVQDAFVSEIVGALALNLSESEQEEIASGHTTNVEARQAFQEGWEHYLRFTPKDNAEAVEHFERAAEIDPEYGRAYSALSLVYVRGCQYRWHRELGLSTGEAFDKAQIYLSEGEKHSSSLTKVAASQIYLYDHKYDKAFTEAARAVARDPNDPDSHIAMGLAMITTGRPEAGLEFVETALRLNPNHPNYYVMARAMAYFSTNDLEQAAIALGAALKRDPGAVELAPLLAASLAHLGRREDARAALLQWQPEASQSELQGRVVTYHFPYKWAYGEFAINDRLADGLYIAALPLDVTVATQLQALQESDVKERKIAAKSLGRFGPAAADAVPGLIKALDDEDAWVRREAVIALGKIGPVATAAVPALTNMSKDSVVGFIAKKALKQITGK